MSLPTIEPLSDEDNSLPPARRRRQRRMLIPSETSDRAAYLEELARRTVPSIDFYLYSLLTGAVIGIALLLDAPALVFLAALLAPFLAPAVGVSLGTVTGAVSFVLRSLVSLGIGSLIVFLCGALAGWAANLLSAANFLQAAYLAQFNWASFVVLALGAALTSYLAVRSPDQNPLVSSAALAYGLYLPAGAAGFGLAAGIAGIWPDGLILFFIHLVWAALIGTLVLSLLGVRPLNSKGYLMSGLYAAAGIAALALLAPPLLSPVSLTDGRQTTEPVRPVGGLETTLTVTTQGAAPSPTALNTATPSPTASTTPSPVPPTPTPSLTVTPSPTIVQARINTNVGGGARIREEPNYDAAVVQTVINDTLVDILEPPTTTGGVVWLHIRTELGVEGWVVQTLMRTVTPIPTQQE